MQPDSRQQEIIGLHATQALVLAGPGCGKTHMLSRRVAMAHAVRGVEFGDMVCLTFTNRAAREMNRRIGEELGTVPDGLFAGNIHRFCLHFLRDNGLLGSEVTVLDEEDRDRWLSETLGLKKVSERKQVLDTAARLFGQDHGFPERLLHRLDFNAGMSHINAATAYADYKRENMLVDFDDLVLLAYDALSQPGRHNYTRCGYRWLQVDEVQDLTPLQLAITDLIMAPGDTTAVYFGDEQQAIFEFAGAGGPALDMLRNRCAGNIYRLSLNYRSMPRLTGMCNDFARLRLGLDPACRAVCKDSSPADGNVLQLLPTSDFSHDYAVAAKIREWRRSYPDESVAVLVHTNDEAESLSSLLSRQGIGHVTVSRTDMFRQPSYKTICAHMAVTANPVRSSEWARLLFMTGASGSLTEARSAVSRLREVGATPADLLDSAGRSELMRFCDAFSSGETVVIDTETTGLDVFEDDIIEISAIKYRDGRRIDGAVLNITVESRRTITPMLRDGRVNPAAAAYGEAVKVSQGEAMKLFAEFAGDAVICAHNADFDCEILRSSYARHAPGLLPAGLRRKPADTLLLSRILFPELRSHTLEVMIDHLAIDGKNSHRAKDDAAATALLAERLYGMARQRLSGQKDLFATPVITRTAAKLREVYGPVFEHSARLRRYSQVGSGNTLWYETGFVHSEMVRRGMIEPIARIGEVTDFMRDMTDDGRSRRFRDQLTSYLHELRTLRESDILACGTAVMTVHRAKGLEFDNVIVYDASERSAGHEAARIRVFYVAFSRARKRLAVFCRGRLSEAVSSVSDHFDRVSDIETEAMALMERLHGRRERR